MKEIQQVLLMTDSSITCDEVKDAKAKSNDEESKTFPTNLNEKIYITCEIENFYTSLAFFTNYHRTTDSC